MQSGRYLQAIIPERSQVKSTMHFYPRVLRQLIEKNHIFKTDKILVVAGGAFDKQALCSVGITNATISNLEPHKGHTDYAPYDWLRLDAESIELGDGSYDWVIVHAGLHHLAVPAMGICEMFRVSKKGIICFEARDSFLMRLAVKTGLTTDYELEAPFIQGKIGGYRNGPIPNYVYRWTEREVEKVVNSYAPTHQHEFHYFYGFSVPRQRFAMAKNPLYRSIGSVIRMLEGILQFSIPKQGNQFGFFIRKNARLNRWLNPNLEYDHSYLENQYDKDKYGRN